MLWLNSDTAWGAHAAMQTRFFQYGERELAYLASRDKRLGEAITRIGRIDRRVTPDLFTALVSSIVGQQISNKALATVWARLEDCVAMGSVITPAALIALGADALQRCGMSHRKADYILSAAEAVLSGSLEISCLPNTSDEQIIAALKSLPGVGEWTAQMLLLFSLERPDVLSFGDLAIRRGMERLYHHKTITRQLFEKYRKRYSPHGSVASLYLWAIAAEG